MKEIPSPSSLKITLKQVAEAAGVSLASASYSLNGGGSVGQQTRERVIATARQLGYSPNLAAKAMRTGRTGAMGLVLPDLMNPFFPQLAQTVISALGDAGYDTFLVDTMGSREAEMHSIDALIRRGVDGLVWFPIEEDKGAVAQLTPGTPVVVVDRTLDGLDCVVADCETGGRLAATLLTQAGHRRIGILHPPLNVLSTRQRVAGARAHVKEHGELVWEIEAAFSADLDGDVIQALVRRDVTGIFAGSDMSAIGAIRALRQHGIRVPEDMSVVGFDNIPWSDLCSPGLTTIDMPIHEMGLEAVKMLIHRLAKPDESRRRVVFDVSAVIRESVAPPR
jgi:LacI family transcriptional regulator